MFLLELTLASAAENLALDEALLDAAEAGELPGPVLRVWHPSHTVVVLGRSSRLKLEVDSAVCRAAEVPVLRRASGGATIVTGPGCLMYAVVVPAATPGEAHGRVLPAVLAAVRQTNSNAVLAGTSDLALQLPDGELRKFSGNALRIRRQWMLYHGTLLCRFDLPTVSKLLRQPPRQPQYRQGRPHVDFLCNLEVAPSQLAEALAESHHARQTLADWPQQRTADLFQQRYSQAHWNVGT